MRIMIMGNCGAGKSSLSRELGFRTGFPVVHLDVLYWQPGWVETPRDQFRRLQREALVGPDWIVDGNYGGTLDERLPLADVVVLLDYPRMLCVAGVLRRKWRRAPRTDMAPGCPERIDLAFLRWVWSYPARWPQELEKVRAHGKCDALVRLRSRREAQAWLGESEPDGS